MWLEIILLALLIDLVIREPPGTNWNPVVWIGSFINKAWRKFKHKNPQVEKINGVLFALAVVFICAGSVYVLLSLVEFNAVLYILISALTLKYCMAFSAFFDTVKPVKESLLAGDLPAAREHVWHLVTRDTSKLDEKQVVSATVESIGENICDNLIAPLFYFALFGVPGAVACRVINLLDGIVGYKTLEKRHFGWFSARFDDVVQFVPARITGALFVVSAFILRKNAANSLKVMLRDHPKDDGINSGWSIAAMAGALNVQLEKPGVYKMGDPDDKLDVKKMDDALLFIPSTLLVFVVFIWLALMINVVG